MSFVYKFVPEKTHVFIHIPKNGGSSLIDSLQNYNPYLKKKKRRPNKRFVGHLTYLETKALFRPKEPLSFFCIARNPWARAVSWYHYIQQFKDHHNAQKLLKYLEAGMSFDDFIVYITQNKGREPRGQFSYMCDDAGNLAVDDILDLSTIQKDLNEFLNKNNCPTVTLETKNASKHAHYTEYFTSDESIRLIAEAEADVIDLCQYEFGK